MKKYDFSQWNKKSHQDVQGYFKKYGLIKTIKKLREPFGQEKIIAEYYSTIYTFPYYPGHIKIRENGRPPFNESIHIIPMEEKD